MAGLLTHVAISLVLFILVLSIFRKFWYAFAIFIGQIIPDAVKFGITGIKLRTLSPRLIVRDSLFWKLESLITSYPFWVVLGILIAFASFFLYYFKKLKKEQAKEINWTYVFLVIGVVIHLIIDTIVFENSYWV